MVKKLVKKATVILASLFLCAVMIFGAASVNIMKVFAAENSSDDNVKYLSDLGDPAITGMESGRPLIKDAIDTNGTKMQVKIEGAWYTFDKGLFTHTSSKSAALTLTYNLENLDYNYFTAYVGLNKTATKGDGVKFNVATSVDGQNWTWMEQSPKAIGPQAESKFITLDIRGAKWLQLWANRVSNNAHDHAVWADAKLTKSLDDGEDVKSLESFNAQIKAKIANVNLDAIKNDKNADLFQDMELEKLVLQREFVSRVGQYALKKFIGESDDNKEVLNWLLNDLDSLREFMLGGTPFKGNYYNSLTVLSKLYKSYKKDLGVTTKLNNKFMPDRTFGELCRTMMFSVALTHDGTIGSYLQASRVENQSEPLRRYAIFKYMYQTERFVATRNADGSWAYETMNLFGSLRVEEMRWVMSNIIDDESIIWLNDYVQTRINANPKNAGNLHTPHSYVRYTDPNYNNPVFYADENYEYFNNLFAVDGREAYIDGEKVEDNAGKKIGLWDTKYTVPAGEGEEPYEMTVSRSAEGEAKLQKVWMNFNNKFKTGSVCGGISKSGTNIRTSRGIPANVIGQPGHAAILYYSKDANGNGSWKIDNDVGGWLAATKGERHLLGWGNDAWQRNSGGTVVYFHLAQACLNDYDNLVRTEEYTWLAKVYQGDLDKQEALYEKALTTQILNLDAWYGLAMTYKANTSKTATDFSVLAGRIADTLWNHPTAMHCLFRLFTDEANINGIAALQDPVFTTQIKSIETNALAKAKAQGSTAAKSKVNYLLGIDLTSDIADFSFDGENAGCIVWLDDYSDGTFTWKYSLDGKKTWNEVTFNEGDSHAYQLSEKELDSISADNDIYVYIVGASPDNAYKIDVAAKPALPDTLYANDWENRVIGVDGTYEWRYCTKTETETETGTEVSYTPTTGWISYAEASPDCSGDKVIEVRLKGTSKKPASEGRIFMFTADTDTAERKYISVNYLSMVEFSTQSQDEKRPNYAVNAIDGNAKTYWHTDYAKSIKNPKEEDGDPTPYLIIKLDTPRWISALEFSQRQYNASFSIFAKKATVYYSEDGTTWEKAGMRDNFENIEDLKAVHFDKPVYGQYVKLVLDDLYETNKNDGIFTTVSLVNIYEDSTKTKSPTGEDMPSLSEVTPSGNAFAGLGDIIGEDKALELGGLPDETGAPDKPNAVLWIVLSVVGGVILIAGCVSAVFFLKHKGIKVKKTDSKKAESKKIDSTKTESKKTDSKKADSKKTESTKTDSTKAESKKADSTKAESKKADSTKAESKKTDNTKAESKKADSTKTESTKTESTKTDSKKAESKKTESTKTDSKKTDSKTTNSKKTNSKKSVD